ncbi:DUF5916 domain-containing protein [Lysobacter sp. GX 14042]|uniref:DUF5916 domain-containing protein n=1 Tax=Lysobacter sp. GX 14042 TaxID=2907155 RepID=UPI001F46D0E3|nr:DUF5916 domain-containing protein [Lysobacter sp. GX 14042]MCE7031828.1 DUF5916 domain-containing protein [Lysobacter sp. GX 14042]
MRLLLPVLLSVAAVLPAQAVEIDGHLSPGEWDGALEIGDFRLTEPLSEQPAPYPTRAWVLSTPEGLAIAFRNGQPPGIARTRQRTRRDEASQVDRVNVMVDFDGDARTAYNFVISLAGGIADEVVTAESSFNDDWDGVWLHAASEDEAGWSAEFLIPWHTAPMRRAHGGTRRIGLYLDRVVAATGERMAWPTASWHRPRFLSDFAPVELEAHDQSLLAVTPYVVGVYDNITGGSDFDAGGDLFWKPSGQFQLAATVNPDFGHVESDDLVVNFSAEETFYSDKRPFFTENQGIFDFGLLIDNSQLVYTRRVGAAADDGSGPAGIDAALKLNGRAAGFGYGLLLAEEEGAAGRSFAAARVERDLGGQHVGLMATRVERPWLGREARVVGLDHRWQPTASLTVASNLVGSDVRQPGADRSDLGATAIVDYQMAGGWRQQWLAMHFGEELELNDFGYLSRNALDYLHYQLSRRITALPEGSAYASHDYRGRIIGIDNSDGLRLQRQLRLIRSSRLRNGGSEYLELDIDAPRYDDLITRGGHPLWQPGRWTLRWKRGRPRLGPWEWALEAWARGGGLAGNDRIGYGLELEPTLHLGDTLRVFAGVGAEYVPDWLVWQDGDRIGRFEQRSLELDAGLDWAIGLRQELRVKLQAIGMEAAATGTVEVLADGRTVASAEPAADFSLRNLGFQVRYRYMLAPLSDLYVVYGRGGYALDGFAASPYDQLGDAFRLRDDEQLLVKLAYRFEL